MEPETREPFRQEAVREIWLILDGKMEAAPRVAAGRGEVRVLNIYV